MSKSVRLQVLLEESELKSIRKVAREAGMTVAEWVRQALRVARKNSAGSDPARKLEIVRASVKHEFPTADITTMLAEISRGYGGDEES